MLSNAYFLAKFRFDTAENEPAKNLKDFANSPNFANARLPMLPIHGAFGDQEDGYEPSGFRTPDPLDSMPLARAMAPA